MDGCITCGLWLLTFLLGCDRLSAFNLDTKNVIRKDGDPGSLFGFSLALHRQLNPDKRLLLVGAPQAKALKGQAAKVTGGLYSCDMTSTSAGCTRVTFDNNEDLSKESKENQWMGVTVSSQGPGGKVLVCAHRYQRRNNVNKAIESRDIIGRCYVLSQDLTIKNPSSVDGDEWHFCDSRARGHEMFGSCQQGLSATFDKDYHYFIFGAPGAYNWKGIVRLEQKNATLFDLGIYNDGPFETGDESEKDPRLVPVPANSYLGFSLDSGKYLTTKDLTVVAGAPRANHSGAVVLLKKGAPKGILLEEYTLEGEGLASSFGYDLAVLDLNGDSWQDIVVGAPQYFEKDGEIGGAVYVFINKAGKWNKVTPIRINGPQDSMFGLAVEHVGDINQDGYQDFAVGAPYDDNGAGKVYIYHGSQTGLKSKEAAQVLSGQALNVRLFGYSLAGNMDLDMNSYPDLAVGSLSDSVFIYRAQPVINIKKTVTFSPSEIDLSKNNCGKTFCLEVKACFTYTASPKSYAPSLTVAYSLEVDAVLRKEGLKPRASFKESADSADSDSANYESKGKISMDIKGKEQCITRQLIIQENIKDKLRGIPVDVTVDIQDAKRKRRQSPVPQSSPVLDANEPKTTRALVNFRKEGCGEDNMCQSRLQVKYRYGLKTVNDETFTPFKLEEGVPVILLSDQKEIALEVTVANPGGDDAYEASVVAELPGSLTYSGFRASSNVNEPQVTCEANTDGSEANCELGNPFKRDSKATFYIIMGTAGISLNTSELEIGLQLKTTSEQKDLTAVTARAKVTIMLQLSLSGQVQPSQVSFSGEVKGESAIMSEMDIGSAITHHFKIINLGKSLTDFGTTILKIDWPKETEEGKWLLYLMSIKITGVKQIDCNPKEEINQLKKEPGNTRNRREAGNTQAENKGIFSRLTEKVKEKTLSCDNGAKCVTISCPLEGLDSNAVITVHSRLWNSTFIESYSKLHHVDVIVKASLHVDSRTENTVLRNAETMPRMTVYPERRALQYGRVQWWIILLSILLGLLLLALLAFLLWKCGFFQRAKYEDKVPSYNAVRIKREERTIKPGNGNWESLEKRSWMTTWHDNEHYS